VRAVITQLAKVETYLAPARRWLNQKLVPVEKGGG